MMLMMLSETETLWTKFHQSCAYTKLQLLVSKHSFFDSIFNSPGVTKRALIWVSVKHFIVLMTPVLIPILIRFLFTNPPIDSAAQFWHCFFGVLKWLLIPIESKNCIISSDLYLPALSWINTTNLCLVSKSAMAPIRRRTISLPHAMHRLWSSCRISICIPS